MHKCQKQKNESINEIYLSIFKMYFLELFLYTLISVCIPCFFFFFYSDFNCLSNKAKAEASVHIRLYNILKIVTYFPVFMRFYEALKQQGFFSFFLSLFLLSCSTRRYTFLERDWSSIKAT